VVRLPVKFWRYLYPRGASTNCGQKLKTEKANPGVAEELSLTIKLACRDRKNVKNFRIFLFDYRKCLVAVASLQIH